MKKLLMGLAFALACVSCATLASAQEGPSRVFRTGKKDAPETDVFRLFTEAPCTNQAVLKVLDEKVPPRFRDGWRAAHIHWNEKDFAACWLEVQDRVLLIDETGDALQAGDGLPPLKIFVDEAI